MKKARASLWLMLLTFCAALFPLGAAVNLTTQLLLILFLSLSGLPYMTAVLVGEIAVYAAEFIAYLFLYRDVSRWRVLGYTALANTATLAMGLLFNQLGWLLG